MSSAAYITNVSKGKQCGPNQTAPDLQSHYLPLLIYRSIMSAYICSRRFEYNFFACNFISILQYFRPSLSYHFDLSFVYFGVAVLDRIYCT